MLLLLALVAQTVLGAPPTHDRARALELASARVAEAEMERLVAATPWLPAPTLRAELEAVANRADWPLPLRERVLHGYAQRLRELAPQPHVDGILEYLSGYPVGVLVAHPESEDHGVPLFNIAAAAAGTRNAWDAELIRERAARALARGDAAYFESLSRRELSSAALTGLGLALSAASAQQLEAVQPGFAALLRDRPEAARLALPAARALNSAEPVYIALSGPRPERAATVVARLDDYVPVAKARALWADLLDQDSAPLASVALVGLGRTGGLEVAKSSAVRLLADERLGASAALALARSGRTEALVSILEDDGAGARARQRAALALKVEGSARSRAALSRLVASQPDSPLAREVAKWLQ